MSSRKSLSSSRSKTSASKKRLEKLEKDLKTKFSETLKQETQNLRTENAKLKRELAKKKKKDVMNVGLFDQENTDQKLIAMENLHRDKSRSLQKSIEKYRLEIKKLQSEKTPTAQTRMIQGLKSRLKDSELKVDVLKEMLAQRWDALKDDEENISSVNEEIIKRTIGGPKRFRPKSREELEEELKRSKKDNLKEKTKLTTKIEFWKKRAKATSETLANNQLGTSESKYSDTESDRVTAAATKASNHEAQIIKHINEIDELRGVIAVKEKQIIKQREREQEANTKLKALKPLENDMTNLRRRMEDKENELEQLSKELAKEQQEVVRLKEDCNRANEELKAKTEVGAKRSEDDMRKQHAIKLKLKDYNNKIKSLEKEIATLHEEKIQQISENKDLTLGAQQKLEAEKKRSTDLEESTRQLQRKSDETTEKLDNLHRQLAEINAEKLEAEKRNVELEKDCENLRNQAQSEVEKSKILKNQLEKIQEAHAEERKNQHDTSQNSLSMLSQDKEKFERQIEKLKEEVAEKMDQLENMKREKNELEATLKKQTIDHDSKNQGERVQLVELKEQIARMSEQISELKAERDNLKKNNKALKKGMKEITQKSRQQQIVYKKKLAEMEAKLN